MGSQVIGNLMGAFLVTEVQESTFYFILTGFCFLSSCTFLLLTKPVK